MNIKITVEIDGYKVIAQESYVSSVELKTTKCTPRYLSRLYVQKHLDILKEKLKDELEAKIAEIKNKQL